MKNTVNKRIQDHLNDELSKLEVQFDADVLVYNGPFVDGIESDFLGIVEELSNDTKELDFNEKKLFLILTTQGGSAHAVESHSKTNPGSAVTLEEKMNRAQEIATELSNNSKWKSHGRPINIEILEKQLRLKIDDYSNDATMREIIRSYHTLSVDYIKKNDIVIFIHTRKNLI